MFTFTSYPLYFPGTDIKVIDVEVRIFASGDDQSLWDVQFNGSDERWHTASAEDAKAILAHVEKNEPLTWGDILGEAKTNPTLSDRTYKDAEAA